MTEYQMMDDFLNDDTEFISEFPTMNLPSSKNFETVFMKIWLIIGLLMIGYVAPTFALLGLLYLVSNTDWSIMGTSSSKPVFEPAYSNLDDDENGSVESEHDHHDHNNNNNNNNLQNNNNNNNNNNHRSKTDHNNALDAVHTHRLTIEEISMKLCD